MRAIWGPAAAETVPRPDPAVRHRQNAALAQALRAYLQLYADEAPERNGAGACGEAPVS